MNLNYFKNIECPTCKGNKVPNLTFHQQYVDEEKYETIKYDEISLFRKNNNIFIKKFKVNPFFKSGKDPKDFFYANIKIGHDSYEIDSLSEFPNDFYIPFLSLAQFYYTTQCHSKCPIQFVSTSDVLQFLPHKKVKPILSTQYMTILDKEKNIQYNLVLPFSESSKEYVEENSAYVSIKNKNKRDYYDDSEPIYLKIPASKFLPDNPTEQSILKRIQKCLMFVQ